MGKILGGKAPEGLLFSRKDIIRMILPAIAEQALAMLVGMADSLMLAGVGERAVSAVSLVDQINILMINLFAALATGGAVIAGQCLGAKDDKRACHITDQLALVQILLGVGISAVLFFFREPLLRVIFGSIEQKIMDYAVIYMGITAVSLPFIALYNAAAAIYRTMGNTRTPMLISILMNGVNICGNALLIYGCGMEVEGAAIPTLVSRAVAAVVAVALLRNQGLQLHFSRRPALKPDGGAIRKILGIGIPNGVENSMFQFGKLVVASLIATFGTASITANAVANAVGIFQVLPGFAICVIAVPIVSLCYGAGRPDQVKYYTKVLLAMTYLFNTLLNIGFSLLIPAILKLYELSAETGEIAIYILLFSAVIDSVLWPPSFMLPNSFRATGDVKYPMVISVASMWIFRVGLSWLLGKSMNMGIKAVWYGMSVDWLFRGVMYYARYFGKNWRRRIGDVGN